MAGAKTSQIPPFPLKSQMTDPQGLITPEWQKWHQSVTGLVSSLQNQAVTSYVAATTQPFYTAAARVLINTLTATNNDTGAAHTLAIYVVPSGAILDNSTLVINNFSLAASGSQSFSVFQNRTLNTGDTIYLLADTANKIVVTLAR